MRPSSRWRRKKWERWSCWRVRLSSASSQNGTTPAKSCSRAARPARPLVQDIMTPDVIYVHLDQSLEECMSIVTERRIRHLPVLDSGRLVGYHLNWRSCQDDYCRAAVHYRTARALHQRLVLRLASALPVWRGEAPFCSARKQRLTAVFPSPPGEGHVRPRLAGPARRTPGRAGDVLPGALWHTSVCIAYTQRRLTGTLATRLGAVLTSDRACGVRVDPS